MWDLVFPQGVGIRGVFRKILFLGVFLIILPLSADLPKISPSYPEAQGQTSCNQNNICEPGNGEDCASCGWDCGVCPCTDDCSLVGDSGCFQNIADTCYTICDGTVDDCDDESATFGREYCCYDTGPGGTPFCMAQDLQSHFRDIDLNWKCFCNDTSSCTDDAYCEGNKAGTSCGPGGRCTRPATGGTIDQPCAGVSCADMGDEFCAEYCCAMVEEAALCVPADSGIPCWVPPAVCGNGIAEEGEECDDGNASNTDLCTNVCKDAVCGDGFEQCSLGAPAILEVPDEFFFAQLICGTAHAEFSEGYCEQCDTGMRCEDLTTDCTNDPSVCSGIGGGTCAPRTGDGDGCTDTCQDEPCGNGTCEPDIGEDACSCWHDCHLTDCTETSYPKAVECCEECSPEPGDCSVCSGSGPCIEPWDPEWGGVVACCPAGDWQCYLVENCDVCVMKFCQDFSTECTNDESVCAGIGSGLCISNFEDATCVSDLTNYTACDLGYPALTPDCSACEGQGGVCQPFYAPHCVGEPVDCDDGNACNTDVCNASVEGLCEHTDEPSCDDGIACTDDTCALPDGCAHALNHASCDDGNGCTDDSCDAINGCIHAPNAGSCDDGNACTTGDACSAGGSCEGTALVCDDGNACNGMETCDPGSGCQAGTALVCDDGLFCNGAESCDQVSGCQPGAPPNISDGLACTDDNCDEGIDFIFHTPNDANCDDGLFCNGLEVCDVLNDCQPGTAVQCDDIDDCNYGQCNEGTDACDYNIPKDDDLDEFGNCVDNCPADYNPGQENSDGDASGDACDLCPEAMGITDDADSDGVLDCAEGEMPSAAGCDNCPCAANPPEAVESKDGIVVTDYSNGKIRVALGPVDGLTPFATYNTGGNPFDVVLADVDSDGDQDAVVTLHNSVNNLLVFKNDGQGVFSMPDPAFDMPNMNSPGFLFAANLDNDPDIELAVSDRNSARITSLDNDGLGHFSVKSSVSGLLYPEEISGGDFDQDGDIDLVFTDYTNVRTLVNDGTGVFTTVGGATIPVPSGQNFILSDVNVGYFNGDSDPDIVFTYYNNDVGAGRVYQGTSPGGQFSFLNNPTPQFFPIRPTNVAVGDFDENGQDDIVLLRQGVGYTPEWGMFPGPIPFNASPDFFPLRPTYSGPATDGGTVFDQEAGIAVGDLNDDDYLDFAAGYFSTYHLQMVNGNGAGQFGTPIHRLGPSEFSNVMIRSGVAIGPIGPSGVGSQADQDQDEFGDACDNCVLSANPMQEDSDEDGIGDLGACYTGPDGTAGEATCQAGIESCMQDGAPSAAGAFDGTCFGEVLPTDEYCDGVDNDCDGVVDDNPVDCNDSFESACDHADSCVNGICESNVEPAGTVCRHGSGDLCDPDETCDGGMYTDCPSDTVASPGTVCNPGSGDLCDPDETCTGFADAACPADTIAPSSTVCHDSAGECDLAESCSGVADAACPTDGFAPSTTQCRGSAGDCDVSESCTGSSADCPTDGFAPSTTQCRGSAGDCDVSESCTGSSADCPADGFVTAGVACRASAGDCDLTEACTGLNAVCPGDVKSTAECRASTGDCDPNESCDGVGDVCPEDISYDEAEYCFDADLDGYGDGSQLGVFCLAGDNDLVPPPDAQGQWWLVSDGLCQDNCTQDANPGQENSDGDGRGDACDMCPDVVGTYDESGDDSDSDGVLDCAQGEVPSAAGCDNCACVNNPGADLAAAKGLVVASANTTDIGVALSPFSNFTQYSLSSGIWGHTDVALADVDGDQDLDAIVVAPGSGGNPDGGIRIFENDGQGAYPSSYEVSIPGMLDPRNVFAGNFDGDGDIDLAVSDTGAGPKILILANDGLGNFSTLDTITTVDGLAVQAGRIIGGDLDHDGDMDLVMAPASNTTKRFYVLRNKMVASGDFEVATSFLTATSGSSQFDSGLYAALGQFTDDNGDFYKNGADDLDIVFSGFRTNTTNFTGVVRVMQNNLVTPNNPGGSNNFTILMTSTPSMAPTAIAVGNFVDINDGYDYDAFGGGYGPFDDIVIVGDLRNVGAPKWEIHNGWAVQQGATLSFYNSGNATAPNPSFVASSFNAPEEIAVGDLNGDGNLDVAQQYGDFFTTQVIFGDGAGSFQAPFQVSGFGGSSIAYGALGSASVGPQEDADQDELGDSCDNCMRSFNPGQEDSDGDGIGDQGPCYDGPSGTEGVATCKAGILTCHNESDVIPSADGIFSGYCYGQVLPLTELCDTLDNDCDGQVDVNPQDCRDVTNNACDHPDVCVNGVCDRLTEPAGTVCRPGSGDLCDPDETCTGVPFQDCPEVDVITPVGTLCNFGSGDLCDPHETCTGLAGQACPANSIAPAGTVCRENAGDCDVPEACNGAPTSPCPDDLVLPATTECRGSMQLCDPAEFCTGEGPYCPEDVPATDTDLDESYDCVDNCPEDSNPQQENNDGDSQGDVCDPDDDNDDVCDEGKIDPVDPGCTTDSDCSNNGLCNPDTHTCFCMGNFGGHHCTDPITAPEDSCYEQGKPLCPEGSVAGDICDSPYGGDSHRCADDGFGALRCNPTCAWTGNHCNWYLSYGCCDTTSDPTGDNDVCKMANDNDNDGICDQPVISINPVYCDRWSGCTNGAYEDPSGLSHPGDPERFDCADATCRGTIAEGEGPCLLSCASKNCNDGSHVIGSACTLQGGEPPLMGTCYGGPDRTAADEDPLCRGDCVCTGQQGTAGNFQLGPTQNDCTVDGGTCSPPPGYNPSTTVSTCYGSPGNFWCYGGDMGTASDVTPSIEDDCPCFTFEEVQTALSTMMANPNSWASCYSYPYPEPTECGAILPCWATNEVTGRFGGVGQCGTGYYDGIISSQKYFDVDAKYMQCRQSSNSYDYSTSNALNQYVTWALTGEQLASCVSITEACQDKNGNGIPDCLATDQGTQPVLPETGGECNDDGGLESACSSDADCEAATGLPAEIFPCVQGFCRLVCNISDYEPSITGCAHPEITEFLGSAHCCDNNLGVCMPGDAGLDDMCLPVSTCDGGPDNCQFDENTDQANCDGDASGDVCDDTAFPDEVCDAADNNCNGQVDEGFDVGTECTVGVGECERTGVIICAADGQATVCSVEPGEPSAEICDGKDNDCNGVVDNDPVDCSDPTDSQCNHPDSCVEGVCQDNIEPDGTSCDNDGNACTLDVCMNQVCVTGSAPTCSTATSPDEIACICPCGSYAPGEKASSGKNHGHYVSCVSCVTNSLMQRGIITGAEKGAIESAAGQNSCVITKPQKQAVCLHNTCNAPPLP